MAIVSGWPLIMRLFTGLGRPKHPVTGTDLAGEVMEVGEGVQDFKVGDRVYAFYDNGIPSQAEYIALSCDKAVAKIPTRISYQDAAASLEAAHYAYNFMNKVSLQAGQKAMLNGGTGAIGSALIQFLKHKGLTVTATCREQHRDTVIALGADRVIDYLSEDFTQDQERYNYVFDAVGKSTFFRCRKLLKPGGSYISSELGPYWQNIYLPLLTAIASNKRVKFPLPLDIKESMAFVAGLLTAGHFRPLIDRVYPLAEARAAYEYVGTGQKVGNVVLEV